MQINLEISNRLNKFLRKAEALATVLEATNLDFIATDVIDNYLWALSDYIREARKTYKKLSVNTDCQLDEEFSD